MILLYNLILWQTIIQILNWYIFTSEQTLMDPTNQGIKRMLRDLSIYLNIVMSSSTLKSKKQKKYLHMLIQKVFVYGHSNWFKAWLGLLFGTL